jgi:trimethylamine--corrinoid protein Co-methyltransferase
MNNLRIPFYKVFDEKNIDILHKHSINILSDIGIVVRNKKILEMLELNGAKVNWQTECVCFSRDLIEKALNSVPSKFILYDRNQKPSLFLGEGNHYIASGHGALNTMDFETGQRRSATKKDMRDFALLSDALSNIDFVAMIVMPQDVTLKATTLHACYEALMNTSKHLYFSPDTAESMKAVFDLVRVITGNKDISKKPIVSIQLSPTSPLTWVPEALDILIASVEAGIPISILADSNPGVSAPITLAGTVAQNNAEVLSGVIIAQLIKPGAPVIYSTAASDFDVRKGSMVTASPEVALTSIVTVQLAKKIGIPTHTCAPETEAHAYDEQQAWEKMFSILIPMLGGGDIFVNGGMFSCGMTASFEQLIIDDEMFGYIKRFIKGFEINEDTLAIETIKEVGHGGSFLGTEHTLKNLRSNEHWFPGISNRVAYDVWDKLPVKSLVDKAHIKAKEIFENHKPCKLPDDIIRKMNKIVCEFDSRYK